MNEIIKGDISNLDEVAPLFDAYRQFYQQQPDLEKAKAFLRERIDNDESTIFIARNEAGDAIGFTQLYPTFCSVAAKNVWVLYDLYVAPEARQQGVGQMLMASARELGAQTNAAWLKLETGVTNLPGQALYEKLGWERDTDFHTYFLDLGS